MSDEKVRPFLTRPAVINWLQWNDFGEYLVKPEMAQVALSLIEEYRAALRETQAREKRWASYASHGSLCYWLDTEDRTVCKCGLNELRAALEGTKP